MLWMMSFNLSRIINISLLISVISFEINCGSSFRIQYDYMKNQNFEPYKTFDFMATPNSLQVNNKSIRRVKKAVTAELENAGFEMKFTKPDFLIAVQTSVNSKIDVVNWGYHYAPYSNYHGGYEYWGTPSMGVYQYEEGTLVIDIIDPESLMLVWRGVAQKVLPPNPDSDRIQKIVDEAVRRILYYWPPD